MTLTRTWGTPLKPRKEIRVLGRMTLFTPLVKQLGGEDRRASFFSRAPMNRDIIARFWERALSRGDSSDQDEQTAIRPQLAGRCRISSVRDPLHAMKLIGTTYQRQVTFCFGSWHLCTAMFRTTGAKPQTVLNMSKRCLFFSSMKRVFFKKKSYLFSI